MQRISLVSLALAGAWLTGSCSPFARDIPAQTPANTDLVGTYQLVSQSLTANVAALTGKQPQITIAADGTCHVADFPVWTDSASPAIAKWLVFAGRWAIFVSGSASQGGKTNQTWAIGCSGDNVSIGTGELTHDRPPYGIVFIYGDPDSGKAMSFEKLS